MPMALARGGADIRASRRLPLLPQIITDGGREYRVLGRHSGPGRGAVLSFPDPDAARGFLERLLGRSGNERALREVHHAHWDARGGAGLDRHRIVDDLAGLLWSGAVRLEELARPVLGGGVTSGAASAQSPAAKDARETSWIEIAVVDDATGDPVGDVKLALTLPRAARSNVTTPASGIIDIDPCDPGACAVDTDLDGATLGSTLEVVGLGEPSRVAAATPFPNTDQRPFRVGLVERHRVRRGESLASIAERAGLSWQELARYNFGTESPKEIDRALRTQVGCRHKTPDAKSFVLDDSDDPGIIYVPRSWAGRGLATGLTHVLRVRRIERPSRPFEFSF